MIKLSEEQIQDRLSGCSGWKLEDGKWIVKRYRFREYLQGIRFVDRIADIAEEQNHHPMIAIDYKLVTLRLTTWNAQGLTELDFAAAAAYDQAFEAFV